MDDVHITILGHASVLVEAGDQRVLVDPLFSDSFANGAIGFHPARAIRRDDVPTPTVIVVTHLHLDHWHPPTLETFDPTTPVIGPDDPWVQKRLTEIGFVDLTIARPWHPIGLGDLELIPTPSDAEVEEFGLVFRHGPSDPEPGHGPAVYWHMSDSDVTPTDGARVRNLVGRPHVVATRYQPITPLISLQRGLGLSHDERDGVVAWLEAACATEPAFLFPYFCDINYLGEHAWANRYARPFAPAEIADLLRSRLRHGPCIVDTVAPGDVLAIEPDGEVVHERAASPFVERRPSSTAPFEPFDDTTLFGVAPADRDELRARFAWWIEHEFVPWLRAQLATPDSPAHALVGLGVRWQVVVHLGDDERLAFNTDFGEPHPRVRPGTTPYPNYAIHISGRALLQVLRGEGGSELFWLAATSRVYEKILTVHDDLITAPSRRGWDLFEAMPEPVSWCLRKHGAGGAVAAIERPAESFPEEVVTRPGSRRLDTRTGPTRSDF